VRDAPRIQSETEVRAAVPSPHPEGHLTVPSSLPFALAMVLALSTTAAPLVHDPHVARAVDALVACGKVKL
jgi:hypothetical protein